MDICYLAKITKTNGFLLSTEDNKNWNEYLIFNEDKKHQIGIWYL